MQKVALVFLIITTGVIFPSCEQFDYNVYQTNRNDKDVNVTTEFNLECLKNLPQKDTLHIVFTGDTQRFYDDLEDMVEAINDLPKVDVVMITGDLTDFAVGREYEWINNELEKLRVPFLTVIGNHDCLAKGTELYENVYGPLNYSFTWNDIRFIMHNTNSREFSFNGNVPDLNWMQQQLTDSGNYRGCIFVSHVGPTNEDFDKTLEAPYAKLIREAKNTVFSVNGHRHNYAIEQPFNDNIWYLNTSSPKNRYYFYVTVYPYAPTGKKFDVVAVPF